MATAASQLEFIAAADRDQLPRYNSNRSGAVFARIVSYDTLSAFRMGSAPLAWRIVQLNKYHKSLTIIFRLYSEASSTEPSRSDEVIELAGAELRVTQLQFELIAQSRTSLPKEQAESIANARGMDKWREGVADALLGTLSMLANDKTYSPDARTRLLMYCRETIPAIVANLTIISQHEIVRRVDEIADDPRCKNLNPQLHSFRDEVQAAAKSHPLN